jgi:hypothetical protein
MSLVPGTVSKIHWHFTGGPRWNKDLNRQEDHPKPIEDAFVALLSILRSKEIQVDVSDRTPLPFGSRRNSLNNMIL